MVVRLFTPTSPMENRPMKAILLLLLTYSSLSFAQGFRMTGNFTLFADTMTPIRSTYTIQWNEINGLLEGRYSDNVLTANTGVTGAIINGKRTFQIVLPTAELAHGIKSLVIETTDSQGMNANVSSTVVAKNMNGTVLNSSLMFAQIESDNTAFAQAQTVANCSTGFGALTGYCGLYSGNMQEQADTQNNCELGLPRLELATNGELSFYFNFNGTLRNLPRHNFGSLLGTPMSQNINTTVRHCGPLPGTQMNSVGCQVLRLVGSFQDYNSMKTFSGTYDIRDEVTGSTCQYGFNFSREATY